MFAPADAGLQAGTVTFDGVTLIIIYDLTIQNDNVALEDDDVFTLMLSSPSSSRVTVGGTASGVEYHSTTTVTIMDDDRKFILCLNK